MVTKQWWQKLEAKLKELTRKTNPMSFNQRIKKLIEVQRGWVNYFKYASIYQKLIEMDGWLRNRLRYCIWHHWKKPEKKRRSLIRLGVDHGTAYAWSRTRMGGWSVAQSPILGTTITVQQLKRVGYVPLIDFYIPYSSINYKNTLFPKV